MSLASTRKTSSRPKLLVITSAPSEGSSKRLPRWAAFGLIFGLFLTLRGYHSFDGDQAYRLPLLLHWQNPTLFADDPFVKAVDQFNPHRGYLVLLDLASKPFGVATALLGLFGLTLVATTVGFDRLAKAVWPDLGGRAGLVCAGLVLLAKAGNIGTNHLFESTLLDRLVGFALGWLAIASAVAEPRRGLIVGAVCLGLAILIHPSVGLQIGLTLATTWGVWAIGSRWTGISRIQAILSIAALGLALAPGFALTASQSGTLFKGLSGEEFRLLAVLIQGPQHLLPSTWRSTQWLAWGCYPVLAILALARSNRPWPQSRVRLAVLIGVNLISLGAACFAIEVVSDLRVTVFQPFRMATLARGLSLVAISGRVVELWNRGDFASRARAVSIGVGLGGDWSMVVATAVDLGMEILEMAGISVRMTRIAGLAILFLGLVYLSRHDTESGQIALIAGLATLGLGMVLARWRSWSWNRRRIGLAFGICWLVPLSSLLVGLVMKDPGGSKWSAILVERCRFAEVPTDDLERLAVWASEHTPMASRFIGPPGPKTFRLWSRRSVAFNRAGSPYHAEGLADWSSRFRDHVGYQGTTADFARAYLADRHGLEAGYARMTDVELARLARSQGADHVLAASNRESEGPDSPLSKIRAEGRFAIYAVKQAN